MYESHYRLTAKPFSIVPNPNILFLSKNHANALTYLEYGLSEKTGFILLTGEIGAGKTTLIRHLINKIGTSYETAIIFNTNFSSAQLYRQILDEFEIQHETDLKDRHLAQLHQFLIERYSTRQDVLLIIDEAQNLTDEALEDIRMLSNLQADDQTLIQIILVGQPELKERLETPEFRQLAQRIAVNYHISPLDKVQAQNYIEFRIQKAGGDKDLFSRGAIEMIYQYSGGIPRTINLICDTALVYGFADELSQINEAVIEKVLEDKICLAAIDQHAIVQADDHGESKNGPVPDEVLKRIQVLEMSMKKLKLHQERFIKKANNDLIEKYQQLLLIEQKRNDQLLEKYFQLIRANHASGDAASHGSESADIEKTRQKKGSVTKFAHLMEMMDAQEAVDKERMKISALLGEEDGRENKGKG